MYFCPCPCNDPHDPEAEEAARVVLPRNLSYVQESYLDRYSVSAGFVHDPKAESNLLRREQQLAHGADTGERTPLALSSPSNVISPNVEDETRALLSILKAKEFHGGIGSGSSFSCGYVSEPQGVVTRDVPISAADYTCGSNGEYSSSNGVGAHNASEGAASFSYSKWTASSIGFLDERGLRSTSLSSPSRPPTFSPDQVPVTSTEEQHTPHVSDSSAKESLIPHSPSLTSPVLSTPSSSSSSASLLLSPASRVASRLSALLHSPPNESMEAERQGTSVDGERLSAALSDSHSTVVPAPDLRPCEMEAPGGLGQEMDRGQDIDVPQGAETDDQDNGSPSEDINELQHSTSCDDSEENVLNPKSEIALSVGHPPRSEVQDIKMISRRNHPIGSPPGKDSITDRHRTSDASSFYESPDSDAFSEEGVFVNMMDDLLVVDGGSGSGEGRNSQADEDSEDENDKSISASVKSDETCMSVDSMFMSPEEGELEEELSVAEEAIAPPVESSQAEKAVEAEPPRKMSLQEAISRAASDLSRMSMDLYGSEALQTGGSSRTEKDGLSAEASGEQVPGARTNLSSLGRSSPVRTQRGLKLTISDYSSSSSSSSLTSDQLSRVNSASTDLTADAVDHRELAPESHVYEENEFNFNRRALRKSSSLKTNKTPPGTPHRKKAVRFADAMGLDLESVRHVLNTNSPPKIPASAMADLQPGLSEDRKEIGSKYLCPCFNQPGASDGFYQRVIAQKLSLENAIITDLTITGFVRVANIAFHKSVRVRYTDNGWATFHDIAASYVQNSCDGPTDRFSFSLVAPAYFVPGHRLEFAVSFNAEGTEYWDNNGGQNYVFECFAKTVPTETESAWIHFL